MAEARSLFWTLILWKLTKSVIQNSHDCDRFRATHYPNPKPSLLPTRNRAEQALSFEIVDADYAGPLCYKPKGKKDLKTCILYFLVVLAELFI